MTIQDIINYCRQRNQEKRGNRKYVVPDKRHHMYMDKYERLVKQEQKRNGSK